MINIQYAETFKLYFSIVQTTDDRHTAGFFHVGVRKFRACSWIPDTRIPLMADRHWGIIAVSNKEKI